MPPLSSSTYDVTVESLGGLGDGIARIGNKPLFIAKSCPGDRLRVRIVHENRDGLHGVIERILMPAPKRHQPPCPHFSDCGGCTLQQLLPKDYQLFKTRMLRSSLELGSFPSANAEVIFIPEHTRRRVEFKVRRTGSNSFALVFLSLRSDQPAAIDSCRVLSPALDNLIAPINAALAKLAASDQIKSLSLTEADSGIDMLITLRKPAKDFGRIAQIQEISRIAICLPDENVQVIHQRRPVTMRLGGHDVALPPGAFLQATRQGQQLLTDIVLQAVQGATSVADLFCGIGAYAFPVSRIADVHAVEGNAAMVNAIKKAGLSAEQRDLFKNPLSPKELSCFDAVIVNPPRLGAKAQVEKIGASPVSKLVMISCNPATFARDARILKDAGFILQSAIGIDQFLWSPHLEIAAVFTR